MRTSRTEAFSDGVIAIAITIMVLELKTPATADLHGLVSFLPSFLTYVLSFVNVGIYWNNHHHLLQLSDRIDGIGLWLNLHLLFWLSLMPYTTRWMDESGFAQLPVLVYGVNLLAAAIAYEVLQARLIALQGHDSPLARAINHDAKGKWSLGLYLAGCAAAYLSVWVSVAAYAVVAAMWIVPDRRLERVFGRDEAGDEPDDGTTATSGEG